MYNVASVDYVSIAWVSSYLPDWPFDPASLFAYPVVDALGKIKLTK